MSAIGEKSVLRGVLRIIKTRFGSSATVSVVPSVEGSKTIPTCVIIVLDVSGSMYGPPIKAAAKVASDLIEACYPHVVFITYHSNAKTHVLPTDEKARISYVSNTGTTGYTNFRKAFEEICKSRSSGSRSSEYDHYSIVFFTDGQHNEGQPINENDFSMLRRTFPSMELHTIGFTKDHDAKLLGNMTRIGTVEGTFRYVQSSSDIQQKIGDLCDVMNASSGMIVSLCGSSVVLHDDGNGMLQGTMMLENVPDAPALEATTKDGTTIEFVVEYSDVPDTDPTVIYAELAAIRERLISSIAEVANGILRASDAEARRNEISADLSYMHGKICSMKRVARQTYMPIHAELHRILDELYKAVTSSQSGQINNHTIATLNNAAYAASGFSRNTNARQFDKKISRNAKEASDLQTEIANMSAKVVWPTNIPPEYDPQDKCFFSTNDCQEAAADGDALCICLDIERTEAAVSNPTCIRVKGICPNLITASSFLDAAIHKLQNGGNVAGHIISVAGFNINAVLPLYICEQNWKVSRLWMKLALGQMVCGNPVAYDWVQFQTVPFLLYARLCELARQNNSSEHLQKKRDLVGHVCEALMKELGAPQGSFAQSVAKLEREFRTETKSRTSDVVSHIPTMLAQVHFIMKDNSSFDIADLLRHAIREQMHRTTTTTKDVSEFVSAYTGFNPTIHVDPYVTEHKKAAMTSGVSDILSKAMIHAFGNSAVAASASTSSSSTGEGFHVSFDVFLGHPTKFAEDELRKFYERLTLTCDNLSSIFGLHMTPSDFGWNSEEKDVIARLYHESLLCKNNAARRTAFEDGTLQANFDTSPENARTFWRDEFTKRVESERTRLCNAFDSVQSGNADAAMAEMFVAVTKPEEAAAILIYNHGRAPRKVYRGDPIFHALVMAMRSRSTISCFTEKMEMLISGRWKSRVVIGEGSTWKPSALNCKIFLQNQNYDALKAYERLSTKA